MRICLATSGTRGDVFPFLAIARELRSRGHEAFVLTHPYFADDAREAGIEIEPLGAEFDLASMLRHPDLFHHRRGQPLVFRWVRDSIASGVPDFRSLLARRRPDLVVSHHFLLGAPQVCAAEGVPFIPACLAPCAWLARDDSPPAPQQRPGLLSSLAARALMTVTRPALAVIGDQLFGPALRRAGLNPGRGVFLRACRGGALNLGLWSRHFRGPCADDPPCGVITGFAWHDGAPGAPLVTRLAAFLDAGPAPIVFAMGSAAHHTAGDFYEMAAAACGALGERGVLLTGENGHAPRDLPSGVRAFPYAPFGKVFPRALVTVQHGGIGSIAQALRAGRPTLVVPRAHDQFNNGLHVERLRVGRTRALYRLDTPRLVAMLRELRDDRELEKRAVALGGRLAEDDGARCAADHIEAFMKPHARPLTVGAAPGAPAPLR